MPLHVVSIFTLHSPPLPTGTSKHMDFMVSQGEMEIVYIAHKGFLSKNPQYTFPFLQNVSSVPSVSPLLNTLLHAAFKPAQSAALAPRTFPWTSLCLCFDQSNLGYTRSFILAKIRSCSHRLN